MDDTTTKPSDPYKRKRKKSISSQNPVAPHGREQTSQVDQVTSQGQPASTPTTTTQSSLLNQNSLYGGSLAVPQQQGTPVVPMMVNQDQIQNLLNLLNQGVSNNQASASNERTLINRENQVSSVPPIPKSEGDADQNKSHPEATTQPDGSRSQSLNYEIATLLASLHNTGRGTAIDSTSSSQQLQGLIQPQQQTPSTPIPQPHTDSPSQEEILQAFFRSMNNPYQNRNVHHVQHQSPTVEGRMLSQYQTHTQTPESSSNPYLQPISQMDYSPNNPFLLNAANMSPSTVRPTNTLDQDVFRLLLMSSAPNSNMGIPIPQFPTILSHHHDSSRDATLNNLILQSLGLAPPPPPPPPPQLGSNVLNMLLGQIAMNPSTFPMNTASFAPSVASHQKNEEDEEGGEKQAPPDDSSSDTCELANVDPIPMSTDMDDDHVSKYQCLVRKQIQFFEANDGDVGSTAQGRNKPIVLGQVGIQCRHCVKSAPKLRARGSVYFPSKWSGIYQAAQNMATAHFAFCYDTPESVKAQLKKLKDGKSTAGGGKKFWGESAAELGLIEDRHGLRFKKT